VVLGIFEWCANVYWPAVSALVYHLRLSFLTMFQSCDGGDGPCAFDIQKVYNVC
jgi:hypothetical protein